jgi:hypothetical protein
MSAMKALVIERESRHLGTCRSCGARIEWATLAGSGKRMPFNPPIVLEGTLVDGQTAAVDMTQTTSHFATCPEADTWRRHAKK